MSHSTSILLLGDGAEVTRLRQRLARHFLAVERARSFDEARELALRCRFHLLVLVDPPQPWPELQALLAERAGLPSDVLFIAERSRAATAVEALRGGVADALLQPVATEDLVATVNAICGRAGSQPRARLGGPGPVLVGESGPMRQVTALLGRIAPAASPVLIEGETGTGRTLLARLLHELSGREGAFVAVDCGAAGRDRLARELARCATETAGDGTLFVHDIHAMPLDLQAELLRGIENSTAALQRGQPVASRIIASTRIDLAELVARHRFREDLYHRLRVMRIGLPPLRERRSDIPLLVAHFVDSLSSESGLAPLEFQPAEIEALVQYDWPGNVRELRDAVEQTLLRGRLPADALVGAAEPARGTPDYPLDWTLEQVKRHHMACVLEDCDGNKSAAARRLDISRKTLDRKLGTAGNE